MKKILICVFMFLMVSTPAFAGGAYLEISSVCRNAENQVIVNVTAPESDIYAGSFNLAYDTQLLEPLSITKGAALDNCMSGTNLHYNKSENYPDVIKINWTKTDSPIKSGVVCTVVFNVLSDEKTVSEIAFDNCIVCGFDGLPADADLTNGKVYLNGVFTNTRFIRDGEDITAGLNSLPVDIQSEIYNADSNTVNADIYVAKYRADNSLHSVEKHMYSAQSGEIITDINTVQTENDVAYIKVFYWVGNLCKPISEYYYIGNQVQY